MEDNIDDLISKICDKDNYEKTIFISCLKGASNPTDVARLGIDVVVSCCSAQIPLEKRNERTKYIHIPFRDRRGVNLMRLVRKFTRKIEDFETVLVNCRLGISRSVSLVIGYFLLKRTFLNVLGARGMAYYDYALDFVMEKRIDAHPNTDFTRQLLGYASRKCWSPMKKDHKLGGLSRRTLRVQQMIDRPSVQIALLGKTFVHNCIYWNDEKNRRREEEEGEESDVLTTDLASSSKDDSIIKEEVKEKKKSANVGHSKCWVKSFNGTIIDTSIESRWGILTTFHSFVDKKKVSGGESEREPKSDNNENWKTTSLEISSSESSDPENSSEDDESEKEKRKSLSERSDALEKLSPGILKTRHTGDKTFLETSLSLSYKLRRIETLWNAVGPTHAPLVRGRLFDMKKEVSFIMLYHFDRREEHVKFPHPRGELVKDFVTQYYTLAIRKFRVKNRIPSSKSNTMILDEHWESIYEKYPLDQVLNIEGGCVMFIKPFEPHVIFDYHREWDLFVASIEVHPHIWRERKGFIPKVVFPEIAKEKKEEEDSRPRSSSDTKESKQKNVLPIEGMVQKFVLNPRNMFTTMFFLPQNVIQLPKISCIRLALSHRREGTGRPTTKHLRRYVVENEEELRESIMMIQRGVFNQCPSANMMMSFRLPVEVSSSLVPGVYDLSFDILWDGKVTSYHGSRSITILRSEEDSRKEEQKQPIVDNNTNNKNNEEEETEGEEQPSEGVIVGKCGTFSDVPLILEKEGYLHDIFRESVNQEFDPRHSWASMIRKDGSCVWDEVRKVVEIATRNIETEFEKWYSCEYFKILFQENQESYDEFMNTKADVFKGLHRANELGFEVLEKYRKWIGLVDLQGEFFQGYGEVGMIEPVEVLQSYRQYMIVSRSLSDLYIRLLEIGRLLPRTHRERARDIKKPSSEEKHIRMCLLKMLRFQYRLLPKKRFHELLDEDGIKKMGFGRYLIQRVCEQGGFTWRGVIVHVVSIVDEWHASETARKRFVRSLQHRYNFHSTLLAHLDIRFSDDYDPFFPELRIIDSPYGKTLSGSSIYKILRGKSEEEKEEMEKRKKKVVVIQGIFCRYRGRFLEGKKRIMCVDLTVPKIQKFIRRHLEKVKRLFSFQEL